MRRGANFKSQIPDLAVPVAQPDRASDFGSEGWGFESLQARLLHCHCDCLSRTDGKRSILAFYKRLCFFESLVSNLHALRAREWFRVEYPCCAGSRADRMPLASAVLIWCQISLVMFRRILSGSPNWPLSTAGGSCSWEHISANWHRNIDLLMTIIEIRPFRNGWQVYESVVIQPVFLDQEQAINYAKGRACFGSGEIRILD